MPTYEYRCKACGHELEVVQAFTDDALTTCPSCKASELRKVFGSVGIAFKGSGFYKNDSRGKSSTSTSSTSSTTGGGSDTSSNGSSSNGSSNGSSSGSSDTASSTPSSSTTSDAKSA